MVLMIGLTRAGQGRTKGRMWPAGLILPRSAPSHTLQWIFSRQLKSIDQITSTPIVSPVCTLHRVMSVDDHISGVHHGHVLPPDVGR